MQKKSVKNRPKNLNLFTIRLPINAVVSILHRVSGVALFLMLPFILLAFQRSVKSQATYTALAELLNAWFVKLMLIAVSYTHLDVYKRQQFGRGARAFCRQNPCRGLICRRIQTNAHS